MLSFFPQVLSSPSGSTSQTSATSISFCGSRNIPCASARWSGMSGQLGNPTRNTIRDLYGFQFGRVQVFLAWHVRWGSGVFDEFSFLRFSNGWCRETPNLDVFFFFVEHSDTSGQPQRVSVGKSLLSLSFPGTYPQIFGRYGLHWWRFLTKVTPIDGLTQRSFWDLHTSKWSPDFGALPWIRWRFWMLNVLKYAT